MKATLNLFDGLPYIVSNPYSLLLFFVWQVIQSFWKQLLSTFSTGWYCHISLRLLQQFKALRSHKKCCLIFGIELSGCNQLQNHGIQQFHQVAANFGKILQSLSVAAKGCWMLSRCEIYAFNAPLVMKLLPMFFLVRQLPICLEMTDFSDF